MKTIWLFVYYMLRMAYQKDSIVTIEFLREENNYLNYLGNTEFDTYGATGKYLDLTLPKTLYDNQPYIYIRLGISEIPTGKINLYSRRGIGFNGGNHHCFYQFR